MVAQGARVTPSIISAGLYRQSIAYSAYVLISSRRMALGRVA